jgi:hypothetical protein
MQKTAYLLSLFILLFFFSAFSQDISFSLERATGPVTLSPEAYNRLVDSLQSARLGLLNWDKFLMLREAGISEKEKSSIETEKRQAEREADLMKRDGLMNARQNEIDAKEKRLSEREAILSENEKALPRKDELIASLRADLKTASESSIKAGKKAKRLETEVKIFKGIAITGIVGGLLGLFYGLTK